MAVTSCPECEEQIPDEKARACPNCGFDFAAPVVAGVTPDRFGPHNAYISRKGASKALTLQILLSALLLIVSLIMMFSGFGQWATEGVSIWTLGVFVGLVWLIVTSFMQWRRRS